MARSVHTQLMFQEGLAAEAMEQYVALFPDSAVIEADYYQGDDGGARGTVKRARLRLAGTEFYCIDSPVRHAFTFTPAMSFFVECDSLEELERTFATLAEEGGVLMPLDDYGFSRRFGWLNDRWGVSWQLNFT